MKDQPANIQAYQANKAKDSNAPMPNNPFKNNQKAPINPFKGT